MSIQHDALRSAAEQFVAACADGNVIDLLDYFEDVFTDALTEQQPSPQILKGNADIAQPVGGSDE